MDPVALRIGPLEVRWYGLMYVLGFLAAAMILRAELIRKGGPVPTSALPEMTFKAILAVLIGGRLGHVIIYELAYYLRFPLEVFATWHGGLSFHGGLIGLIVAGWIWCKRRRVPFLAMADPVALAAVPGIMFAKIGNFINGELVGRVTDLPWGVVFPHEGPLARHPSQLYEALLEGPVLFFILWRVRIKSKIPGGVLAAFLIGYGALRFLVEFFRQPEPPTGLVLGLLTMGQIWCLGMVVGGIILGFYLRSQKTVGDIHPLVKPERGCASSDP